MEAKKGEMGTAKKEVNGLLQYHFYWRKEKPRSLVMYFKPEQMLLSQTLSMLFFEESGYERIMKEADRVLNGEAVRTETAIQDYGLEVGRETTSIYEICGGKRTDEEIIRTEDFTRVLTAWHEEKERFDKWKQRREKREKQEEQPSSLQYSFYWRKESPRFLIMNFYPESSMLSVYLTGVSGRSCYEWIVDEVDRVLNGEIDYAERDTECYGANITRETTSIYFAFDEDNTDEETIRTEDFRAALTAWIEEKERFDKWKRKKEKQERKHTMR